MLKTLKFSGNETDYFVVSDLHYGHDRNFIYGKRKDIRGKTYESVSEHDNGIVEAWNSVCNENSVVFNCGDVVFNDPDGKKFWELMRRINFKEHYVFWGNHTSGQRPAYLQSLYDKHPEAFSLNREGNPEPDYEIYPLRVSFNTTKTIIFVPQYAEIQVNSTKLMLFHYPIISHNGLGKGFYHICGHSHGTCDVTNKNTGRGFRLDVGIESFGRPISIKEVKSHLKNRTLDTVDHHNEKTT